MVQNELPKFVQELLDRIIKENSFNDCSVQVKKGSQAGDGFSSEIFSVTIAERNRDKKLDLVCKVAPSNEHRRKEFFSNIIFNLEATFYSKIAPIFEKFQEEKNVPKEDQFLAYPKCYGTVIDNDNGQFVICLEDLRSHGFKMWNKAKPSPIANEHLAMLELGKLHGLSVAMKDQKPEEFAELKQIKDLFKSLCRSENVQSMLKIAFDRAIKSLRSETHKNIMSHIKGNIVPYAEQCLDDEASDQFGVFCHGDYWNNNLLFRFGNQDIAEDIRILDWQMIRYASPAIDLIYNIFTSTDKAFRDKEYDNLLEIYHKSLSRTVQLLGSNPNELFTFENLKDELKRCGNYVLFMAPLLMQVSLADSSRITNLDEMFDDMAKGESKPDLITGLSDEAQLEYDRRLNEVFEDVTRLGYYQKVDRD